MVPYESIETMNGLERSALLLNVLGNEVTAQIFKKMKDNDVKRLVTAMGSINKVPIDAVKEVLEAFYKEIAEEETLIFGHAAGRDFVLATLGEERAKTVLGQLSVLEGSRTLEALELVDPRTLANFLVNEHPQTVALVLAHLEFSNVYRKPFKQKSCFVFRTSTLFLRTSSLKWTRSSNRNSRPWARSIRSNWAVFNRSPKCSTLWTKPASRTSWLVWKKKIHNWRKKFANSCSSSKTLCLSTTVECKCFSRKFRTTSSLSLSKRRQRKSKKRFSAISPNVRPISYARISKQWDQCDCRTSKMLSRKSSTSQSGLRLKVRLLSAAEAKPMRLYEEAAKLVRWCNR
jgi:hypothetical protein